MGQGKGGVLQPALRYLQQLSIAPSRNTKQFIQEMERKHGKPIASQLAEMLVARSATGKSTDALYDLKNSSLDLSLDFACFSADLYRRFFDWLVLQDLSKEQTVLDIGCDNGIATCFYALLLPHAQITGIDVSAIAIARARELAARMEIENVRFEVADFRSHVPIDGPATMDLIISLRSLTEVVGDVNEMRYWSLEDLENRMQEPGEIHFDSISTVWSNVFSNLSEQGRFLSLDRLTHAGAVYAWVRGIASAGLQVDWKDATWLLFHEVGIEQQFPLISGRRGTALVPNVVQETYRFLAARDTLEPVAGRTLLDDQAVLAFRAAERKEFVEGVNVTYPNHAGAERRELWIDERRILLYALTDRGSRELIQKPLERLQEERETLLKWMQLRMSQGCLCSHYREPI